MNQIGLIFDMDGVIVDNHKYHYLSWQKVAEKYDKTIDETFYREKMNGRTLAKLMDVVFDRPISAEEAKAIGEEKESTYRELYKDYRAPMPGLIDLLENAKSKNVPLVVGTSAPKANVDFTLDALDLRKYFVGIVDDSMVKHGKPDPEVYLKCAAMAQRKPEHCIVFEDAISGIQAGQNAGANVVALATSHARHELNAEWIIDDFNHLTWNQIEEFIYAKS